MENFDFEKGKETEKNERIERKKLLNVEERNARQKVNYVR